MIIGFIVVCIVAILFLGLGVSCLKSTDAVGFFSFVKPPTVTNIVAYNKAVSILWFVASGVILLCGIPFLFLEQNSPLFVPIIFVVMILVIGMMIAYVKIEAKYTD